MARGLSATASYAGAGVAAAATLYLLWSLSVSMSQVAEQQAALTSALAAHQEQLAVLLQRQQRAGQQPPLEVTQHRRRPRPEPPRPPPRDEGDDGEGDDSAEREPEQPAPRPPRERGPIDAKPRPRPTTPRGNPPPPPAKPLYVKPEPLPEWALVEDAAVPEGDIAALAGEGVVWPGHAAAERSGNGVLFNAIHRQRDAARFSRSIHEAVMSAVRMQEVLAEQGAAEDAVGYALATDRIPWEFMVSKACNPSTWPECTEFAKHRSVLQHVLFYEELAVPPVIPRRERFQTWPELWLMRSMATLNSPFAVTMIVDTDVYACARFDSFFSEWVGPETDLAVTLAPAPFGSSRNYNGAWRAGFPRSYSDFVERNLGFQVMATGRPHMVQLVSLFRDIYARQVNDTAHVDIGNDQSAFREALFTMRGSVRQKVIPPEVGCRHERGCADGCLVVHRHSCPECSAAEIQERKRLQQEQKRAERAAAERE